MDGPACGELFADRYELRAELLETPAYRSLRAFDREVEVDVDLWWMRPEVAGDARRREAFLEAAAEARAVQHVNLRRIHDVGVAGNDVYVICQLPTTTGLAARLRAGEAADDDELWRYAEALAGALSAAHERGLLHGRLTARDVAQVAARIKVGAVGLLSRADPGLWVGEPLALAPEVRAGAEASPAADVYAMAWILGELAVGRVGEAARRRLPELRPELWAVLAPVLDGEPRRRPEPMALLERLGERLGRAPSPAPTSPSRDPALVAAMAAPTAIDAAALPEAGAGPVDDAEEATVEGPGARLPAAGAAASAGAAATAGAQPPADDAATAIDLAALTPPPEGERTEIDAAALEPAAGDSGAGGHAHGSATGGQAHGSATGGQAQGAAAGDPGAGGHAHGSAAGKQAHGAAAGDPGAGGHAADPGAAAAPAAGKPAGARAAEAGAAEDPSQSTLFAAAVPPARAEKPRFTRHSSSPPAPAGPAAAPAAAAGPAAPAASPYASYDGFGSPIVGERRRGQRPTWVLVVGALAAAALASAAVLVWSAGAEQGPGPDAAVAQPAAAPRPKLPPPLPAEPLVTSPQPCPADMAHLPERGVCVDTHEAPGRGRLPITGITRADAEALCAERGARLCTGDEWEAACRGDGDASFPYGPSFRRGLCNLRGDIAATGAHPACKSAAGAFDMSGNVAEWVAAGAIRGGSAQDQSRGRCSTERSRPGRQQAYSDVGFRCCAEALAPPQ